MLIKWLLTADYVFIFYNRQSYCHVVAGVVKWNLGHALFTKNLLWFYNYILLKYNYFFSTTEWKEVIGYT